MGMEHGVAMEDNRGKKKTCVEHKHEHKAYSRHTHTRIGEGREQHVGCHTQSTLVIRNPRLCLCSTFLVLVAPRACPLCSAWLFDPAVSLFAAVYYSVLKCVFAVGGCMVA